jgi:hypothetical protein
MREGEILNLKWKRVNRKTGFIRLKPEDTKTSEGRPREYECGFQVSCGFDKATELDLTEFNKSAFQPPREDCTFRIVYAVVE